MSIPLGNSGSKRARAANGASGGVHYEISLKSILIVLAVIAGLWLMGSMLPALLVLVMALMLVGALHPPVAWLEQRKVRRFFAICIVFGLGIAVSVTILALTVPTVIAQVKDIVDHEPEIREKVAGYLEQSRFTSSLADDIRNARYTELLKSSQAFLLTLSTRIIQLTVCCFAALFLAFYIMIDRDRLRGALFAVVPRRHHVRLSRILLNLGTIVGGYIRGQIPMPWRSPCLAESWTCYPILEFFSPWPRPCWRLPPRARRSPSSCLC
jgi:predicted PurR-regulated permease PerM